MIESVEAIIVSEDHYNALGVIRSLGIAGISVNLVLTTQNGSFCDKSRFVGYCLKTSHDCGSIIRAINGIADAKKDKRLFVFPLNDSAAQLIDSNLCAFRENLVLPNMKGRMHELAKKTVMKEWAEQFGFAVPKGKELDLSDRHHNWNTFPAILKPLVSAEGLKSDIVTVDSISMLEEATDALRLKGYKRVLIEEYITGIDEHMVEIMGEITSDGDCSFAGIISKIREFPIINGSTAFAEVVDEHDGVNLVAIAELLKRLGFCGLFDFEFKYADGTLFFIECNFRNGAPGWALSKLGHNLPVMWICDSLNEPIIDRVLTKNRTFMCEQNDVINMLKKDVGFFQWCKDFFGSSKVMWMRCDLAPVIKYYCLFIKNRVKR